MTPEERTAVRTAADALVRTAAAEPMLDAQILLATAPAGAVTAPGRTVGA